MFLEVSQLQVRYAGAASAAVDGVSLGLRAGELPRARSDMGFL